jgi:hypothetical protein
MALPSSYEGSVVSLRSAPWGDDPRFTSPELPCRSVSNHPASSHVRFVSACSFSRSGLVPVAPFPVCAHQVSGFRLSLAGSSPRKAESSFSRTDQQARLRLLSTPPSGTATSHPLGDAVAFGFRPVKRLVERDLTSFSDVLTGARVRQLAAAFRNWQSCERPAEGRWQAAARAV